jgi:hypothetical protein
MDKLTTLVVHYQKTHDNKDIPKIQNIIYPIIKKLLHKWHFDNFPSFIKDELLNDSNTVILCRCLNRFDLSKGRCKFSSYYATSENFYLRRKYMTYFQKGKPIQKNIGYLNTISLNEIIDDENTELIDCIQDEIDTRHLIDERAVDEAMSNLSSNEKDFIEKIFFENNSKSKLCKKLNLSRKNLEKNKEKILNSIKNNI